VAVRLSDMAGPLSARKATPRWLASAVSKRRASGERAAFESLRRRNADRTSFTMRYSTCAPQGVVLKL
jgi:hypothetical protein